MNYPESCYYIVQERRITFLVAMDNFTDIIIKFEDSELSESVWSQNVKAKNGFLCHIMTRLKVSKREH